MVLFTLICKRTSFLAEKIVRQLSGTEKKNVFSIRIWEMEQSTLISNGLKISHHLPILLQTLRKLLVLKIST